MPSTRSPNLPCLCYYTGSMPNSDERQAFLALPIHQVPFVLLDIESTGLSVAEGDRVCEIALVRYEQGQVTRRWETLVNPGRPISLAAYAVNHIDQAVLTRAPTFEQIADRLVAEVEGAVLVAHNIPFDLEFLDTELARIGRAPLSNVRLDTLTLARCFLLHDRYSLSALARDLGFDRPSHRAMSDVLALVSLFDHLLNRLGMLGVSTLGDLVRAHRGLLPGEPEPVAPPLLAEALRNGTRLRIAYRSRGGEPTMRDILPLELQVSREMPRLVAYCYLRNGQRTFYLDRIDEYALPSATQIDPTE
jgi:DNA polymerase III subunit epsilon